MAAQGSLATNALQLHTCPTVAVLAAGDLAGPLRRNGFRSLAHLLAPFLAHNAHRAPERIQTRTPATYDQVTHSRFPVRLVDARTGYPPAPAAQVDLLLDQLGQDIQANVSRWISDQGELHASGDSEDAPWYRTVRDHVLRRRDLAADLDSFHTPLATLVALSTANPDPLNTLADLWDQAHASAADRPDRLRFVLLVHDNADPNRPDWADAQKLHDTVRKTYGLHTALVSLFSAAPGAPDAPAENAAQLWEGLGDFPADSAGPPSTPLVGLGVDEQPDDAPPASSANAAPSGPLAGELSTQDLSDLAAFAREFVVQSLVPFLERVAIVAHEQWVANRRSLGGRLFSAGRKYFGGGGSASPEGSRAGSPGPGAALSKDGYNASKGLYHPLAQLSLTRRLADLCIILGDPKLAHAIYESLVKDYRADKAWRHAAAATRMAGLSSLLVYSNTLSASSPSTSTSGTSAATSASSSASAGPSPLGSPNNNPDAYLAVAAGLLLHPPSPADYDALRSTLLYYELYRSVAARGPSTAAAWALASDALVRTAGEADEVVSAVLLEQAARADWNAPIGLDLESDRREGRGRRRKYAFHLAMAAVRYEKCGIKALSRRSLAQAAVLFQPPRPLPPKTTEEGAEGDESAPESPEDGTTAPPPLTALLDPRFPPPPPQGSQVRLAPWLAIRTYMHHSLARQAYTVGDALDAIEHFLQLLVGGPGAAADGGSSTSGANSGPEAEGLGGDWLDDFALTYSLLGDDADRLVSERGTHLPVQLFDARRATLVSSRQGSSAGAAAAGLAGDEAVWKALEEEMLKRAAWRGQGGKRPRAIVRAARDAPLLPAASRKTAGPGGASTARPPSVFDATVGETFTLEVPVRNPLEAFLALGEVRVAYEVQEEAEGAGVTETAHATMDVELAPMEESKVFIPIPAHKLGSILIKSISYRFSGLLPTTESLLERWSTPTPARPDQPSRRERLPLRARVRPPQPRIEIDLEEVPTKLFHGEARTIKVTLRNVGQQPVDELHLLASQPACTDLSRPESASGSVEGFSNSIASPAPIQLLEAGARLAPGADLKFSMTVRGDAPGQQHLHFLCVYRQNGQDEAYSSKAARILEVYPSLSVRWRARPCFDAEAPFSLDLEVYNAGLPADDVVLRSVSVWSPTWHLSEHELSAHSLAWQQSATFSFRIHGPRPGTEVDTAVDSWSVRQVQAVLEGKNISDTTPPNLALSATPRTEEPRPRSLLTSYASYRRDVIAREYQTIERAQHPDIFPLFSSRAAVLVLSFSSTTLQLAEEDPAQLFVPLDAPCIGSAAGSAAATDLLHVLAVAQGIAGGLYAESQRERAALLGALRSSEILRSAAASPVVLDVQYPASLQHDFTSGPALLPIEINLRNVSPTQGFEYTLDLTASIDAAPFVGALVRKGSIAPLASDKRQVQAWIPQPGTVRIGIVRLLVAGGSAAEPGWQTTSSTRPVRVRPPDRRPQRVSAAPGPPGPNLIDAQA